MFNEAQKHSRGEALAQAFFFRMDRELIESLSRKLDREEKIGSFQVVTGIQDREIVESLVDAGFEMSTLTAFIWAPVVFVAWADGNADRLEKAAILDALPNKGVSREMASLMIAHDWFANRPTEELWRVWEEFATATLSGVPAYEREALMDEIVKLCCVVAHASGGFLGIAKVSPSESEAIDRVIATLKQTHCLDEQAERLSLSFK